MEPVKLEQARAGYRLVEFVGRDPADQSVLSLRAEMSHDRSEVISTWRPTAEEIAALNGYHLLRDFEVELTVLTYNNAPPPVALALRLRVPESELCLCGHSVGKHWTHHPAPDAPPVLYCSKCSDADVPGVPGEGFSRHPFTPQPSTDQADRAFGEGAGT